MCGTTKLLSAGQGGGPRAPPDRGVSSQEKAWFSRGEKIVGDGGLHGGDGWTPPSPDYSGPERISASLPGGAPPSPEGAGLFKRILFPGRALGVPKNFASKHLRGAQGAGGLGSKGQSPGSFGAFTQPNHFDPRFGPAPGRGRLHDRVLTHLRGHPKKPRSGGRVDLKEKNPVKNEKGFAFADFPKKRTKNTICTRPFRGDLLGRAGGPYGLRRFGSDPNGPALQGAGDPGLGPETLGWEKI